MSARLRIAALIVLGGSLSGCVAAAIPLAASAGIVKEKMAASRRAAAAKAAAAKPAPTPSPVGNGQGVAASTLVDARGQRWTVQQGLRALPPPSGTPAAAASSPGNAGSPVPPAMQYLYGSGEAAAGSQQAYRALETYLATIKYRRPETMRQLVMNDGATLAAPYFEPCGKKPPAVVLDIDETALLNLGYEGDEAQRAGSYDEGRWQRWETTGANAVTAVPGAKAALDAARAAGITVIFNSNRSAANAAATGAALAGAGLGPAVHRQTLWLKGDDGGGSAKDGRRWAIAGGYCVVALVGDQLGDFSDLFNDPALTPAARRAAAAGSGIAELWGNGWFVLPNPVYGTALKGGFDDVFPADKRWKDPQ